MWQKIKTSGQEPNYEFLQYILLWVWPSDDARIGTLRVTSIAIVCFWAAGCWGKGCHGVNRASKNGSASTSGSDREAPSVKQTVLTSSLDLGSFSEISLMVDFTNNCIMYKRANFILHKACVCSVQSQSMRN